MKEVLQETSEKIIQLIEQNPEITIQELADSLKKSTRAIEMQLQNLKEKKRIVRIGPAKGGHWEVVE